MIVTPPWISVIILPPLGTDLFCHTLTSVDKLIQPVDLFC